MRGPVQWIVINRPERRNALNEDVVAAIDGGIAAAQRDDACRAIVLTGAGDAAFCAGADLKTSEGGAFHIAYGDPKHYVVDLLKRMDDCRLPIVARVNGAVMAGGMGLLCACDLAVAADHARFGTPESRLGLYPMMILGPMQRIIPRRKLMEMCITGEPVDAAEALAMGLVNHVVPRAELDAKTEWLLARIVDKSPTGVRLGKMGFHAMQDMSLREALEYAQVMIAVMSSSEDAREGLGAFVDKRAPRWTGR
jgi:enoyl-CoA hydratase/carnithine racemase